MGECDTLMPLYSIIKNYSQDNSKARFHTPGHSGVDIDGKLYKSASYDITELSFSDNLMCPNDVLAQSEELTSQAYGAKHILYLTSGGSGAVLIALNILKNYGKTIIVDKNAHISIMLNARLLGMEVIETDIDNMIVCCKTHKDIAGVIITSPDYYGCVTDCAVIKDYLAQMGIYFIIDHSHGMHYAFSDILPQSMVGYADIVICSMHKTLPVMTSGAMLAINCEELYNYALYYRMTVHSTSPNYMVLSSIDFARGYMLTYGKSLYDNMFKRIDILQDELVEPYSIRANDDCTRLVIDCGGLSGYCVSEELQKLNVYPEMADNNCIVFILTPFNAIRITQLAKAINSLKISTRAVEDITHTLNVVEKKIDIDNAIIEFVDIEHSINRICASEIAIYPPAVPLLRFGSIIDKQCQEVMLNKKKSLIGLVKGLVPVVK